MNPQISISADETAQVQVVAQATPEIPVAEWIQEQSAVTDLVKPQISITADEASQVVGLFPLLENFAAPMNNQVHQERIVATVQQHVIGEEIPQLPIVEWIQEQIVETIEVIPQEERVEVQMNTCSTSTSNTIPVIESVTPAPVVAFNPVIEYVSEDAAHAVSTLVAWDTAAARAGACAVSSPTPAVQQIVAEETTQDLVATPVCAGDIGFDTRWE